jgi:hypothetical protein
MVQRREGGVTVSVPAKLMWLRPGKDKCEPQSLSWMSAITPICLNIREAANSVRAAKVQVTILDDEGKALEKGEATKGEGNWWEFTCNTKGKTIIAEAWDLPNNVTKFVME